MATVAENLQTIADSTAAIKQAIIDKGGDITGDITTWAEAINGITSGGGDLDIEVNNVYISMSSSYAAVPGTSSISVFCVLEKPLDVPIYAVYAYDTGDTMSSGYKPFNAGTSEFTIHGLTVNGSRVRLAFADFWGTTTKYLFKYNYI